MNIPANTLLGFLGGMALIVGVFLILTGTGIIKMEKVTVEKSKKTVLIGFILLLIGIGGLWTEISPLFSTIFIKENHSQTGSQQKVQSTQETTTLSPLTKEERIRELDGYTFELQECKREMEKATCYFQVISHDQDRPLRLHGIYQHRSRIFDEEGNEYWAVKVQIADKIGENHVDGLLIANLPIKVSISFNNVRREAKMITLMNVLFYTDLQYRNIPITE